ncbi:hypothetical protein JCM4914_33040 [Streptomyces platensis subsp. malvinus]
MSVAPGRRAASAVLGRTASGAVLSRAGCRLPVPVPVPVAVVGRAGAGDAAVGRWWMDGVRGAEGMCVGGWVGVGGGAGLIMGKVAV